MGLADWFRRRGAVDHDDDPPEPDDHEREDEDGDEDDAEDPTAYPLW